MLKPKTKEVKENKGRFKEKIKNFLKNKKAVAMLMEYIITIECFAMLFLLVSPNEVKAASISVADENGITWAYTLSNGQATNVYYESGTLGNTVTIPATLSDGTNEYPVVSLFYKSSYNIFKTNFNDARIEKVIIPEGVTSIGDWAFYYCTEMITVEMPSTVKTIGQYAFGQCYELINLEIPNSVTSIYNHAFFRCESLENIFIPQKVTYMDSNVFRGCDNLTSLIVDENNNSYCSENNILYNKNKTNLLYCVRGKEGEVVIPNSVKSIGSYAFEYCSSLTSVNIPSSVTSIGGDAFVGCSSLTNVEIPSSVTSIGDYAFYGCSSLTSIVIPEGVASIEQFTFSNCTSLTSVVIQEGIISIGKDAFSRCTSLKTVEIPSTVTSIGDQAFYDCTGLTSVVIQEGIISIGGNAFFGCTSLKTVEIPSTITSMGGYAFAHCNSLTSVEIPEGITNISNSAFYYCKGLINVEIPSSVTSIGSYAFSSCSKLENIYINNLKTNISFGSYWNRYTYAYVHYSDCTHTITKNIVEENLQIIDVSNNLTDGTIGCGETYKFKVVNESGEIVTDVKVREISQGNLTNSSQVTSWLSSNEEGIYTIENINRNKTFKVGIANGETFKSTDENGITWNYTYQNGEATNVYYQSGTLGEKVTIPSNLDGHQVVSVYYKKSYNIFRTSSNSSIKEIVIPDSVIKIGTDAFYKCTSLTSINIPDSITTIEYYAFRYCSSLTSIEIPSSVTEIGTDAFNRCTNLTDIYVDNVASNITRGSWWNANARVHYSDCTHTITIENDPREKVEIEPINNKLENGTIACGEKYQFKLINEQGEVVTGKEIRIKSQGEFTNSSQTMTTVTPNEEGIYTIEDINRNKTIIIGAEDGEILEYTDGNGITWEYTYEDKKARALKYISGDIPEILEVPANIDGIIVTTMANGALTGQNVKNVILPDSIINIGQSAFENCTTLETIVLPEGLQLISNSAFKGCTNLTQVELPDNLLVIGNEAFSECTNLKMDLTFKDGIRAIGRESFKNCVSLEGKLTLPGSILQVGTGAFKGCTGITKVEILSYMGEDLDESIINISDNSSTNASIDETGTSDNITKYTELTGVYEANAINNSTNNATNNTTEPIILIKREVTIGLEAFSGCSSLIEIHLPEGINKVEYSTIADCNNLTDLYIATKKEDMVEEVQTNGQLHVHYLDCTHTVTTTLVEGTNIEEVSETLEEGVGCQKDYNFKVNIAEGSTLKGVVVKVGNVGEEKEAIKPDENGIYTIENITKDKEVSIEEGRIVEVRYIDKDGNKIAKSTILVGEEGESYKAERKEIANYKAVGEEPANSEGTFTQEEIVVTYVYEKIPSGTLTIKYVDKEGKDIIDPDTKQGYVGDEYEILRKNIRGYKAYGVTPENAKGTYTEEDIEIIFVYEEIKEEETVIKYVDEEGNYIARDKTVQEGEEADQEAKEVEGYEKVDKTEEGKEIIYTYGPEDKTGKANKWTTEKTLLAIAGMIGILILIFIIIARREKEVEMKDKKYRKIEEAIEEKNKSENKEEIVEIKLLKDIERQDPIEGLDDETIKIDYNGYEIKINEEVEK